MNNMKNPAGGAFLTRPYLLSLDPGHEMSVVWLQTAPSRGRVCCGTGPEALDRVIEAVQYTIEGLRAPASPTEGYAPKPEENPPMTVYQYIAVVDGLRPGQRVYYRCEADGEATEVFDFFAAPPEGAPYRFALMSDLQCIEPCDESVRRVAAETPDFILYAGDLSGLSWRADKWFDLGFPFQTPAERGRSFFPCMQQPGCRLMSHIPTYFCPGNHELDDLNTEMDKTLAADEGNWHCRIFAQLMRPLYRPDRKGDAPLWYTARYSDMQIYSLSVVRWATWDAYEAPGWRLLDDIAPESPQIRWLEGALAASDARFKWVVQHWHLLNKGEDTQPPLCRPEVAPDGTVRYPVDHGTGTLMPLYEKYGVNGVSYGHSHVYERYVVRGVHYIEAAYLTVCYRAEHAPLHPSGAVPVVEDNSERSYAVVTRGEDGLVAEGHRVANGAVFDRYRIAGPDGKPDRKNV